MVLSILQVFCAIFSGLLQALSISNSVFKFGSPFIALFALVPMYYAFYSARSYRKAFLIFFVETLTVHIFSSSWLANFHGFAAFTLGASALGTGVLGGLVGIATHFFPAQLFFRSDLDKNSGSRTVLIPCRILWFCGSWVVWEWIKSTGLLAYPWGTVSMAAYRWKIFTQIADITGVWGITFIYTLFSATLGEGIAILLSLGKSPNPNPIALAYKNCCKFLLTVFLVCGIYGLFQYLTPRTPVKYMNTIMVQPNGDPWETGDSESIKTSMELTEQKMNEVKESGDTIDLVLWSEGILNSPFPRSLDHYEDFPEEESLISFIKRTDVPFIIGGAAIMDHYSRKYANTAILFDRRGKYAGFYSKMHLVPFAELIPLSDTALMQWFMNDVVKLRSRLIEGEQSVVFEIPLTNSTVRGYEAPLGYNLPPKAKIQLDSSGLADIETAKRYTRNDQQNPNAYVTFSTPICFEDAFPDVCRTLFHDGSEVFLNITNDSWSKNPSAEYQHFIASSYRAIEFRTTLARCTNSGYSAIVEPNGKIRQDMELFKKESLAASIPIYKRKITIFSVLGDWFVYTVLFFMASYFLVSTLIYHWGKEITGISITISIGKDSRRDIKPKAVSHDFLQAKEPADLVQKDSRQNDVTIKIDPQPSDTHGDDENPVPKRKAGRPKKSESEKPSGKNEQAIQKPKRNYTRKRIEAEPVSTRPRKAENKKVAKERTIKVTNTAAAQKKDSQKTRKESTK